MANLVLGDALADRLLHRVGTAAAATVTGSYATGNQSNDHDVMGYHVLIRTPRDATAATSFEDDDFNVYPPQNATSYPGQGNVFTVRYLPAFAGDFTIVSDDPSPWAQAGRCATLDDTLRQAQGRVGFSHALADQNTVARALRAAEAARCG